MRAKHMGSKVKRFIVILLITLIFPDIALASRGIVPVSIKDKSGNEIGLYKESHALVIGVSDYTNGWQDLESVPTEIDDLVSALEAQGFHVVRVLNPDSEALEKSFKDFINQYGFDPDNRLLFFFSGHGHTRQVGKITKGYLVPTDAPIPENDPKGFKSKALSMKRIITWAEGEIESKHALFLFDSCFSGTILKSRGKPPIPRPIKDSTNHPVRQFISAGSAGQLVPSKSVFAPYFIRALKGEGDMNNDGYVTGTELGLYLRDQIMGGDTHQTPQVGKSFNPNFNEGDFVFPLKMAKLDVPVVDDVSDELERKKAELKRLKEMRQKSNKQKELDEINLKLEEEKRLARTPVSENGKPLFPVTPELDIFKNSDYYFNRAILFQQSRLWEKALTNYSKAAELDANNPDTYNNMGVVYKEMRLYDQAVDKFLRAIQLNSNYAKPYNNIGVVYYAKKDFPSAIRNYQKSISIEPDNLETLNNLAVAYKRSGQLEKSKETLNQALKIDTNHSKTNYNLAVLYEKEGNRKSAIHFYQRFIQLGSTSHPALSTQVKKHLEALDVSLVPVPMTSLSKAKSSGKCPDKMSFIPGGVFLAGKVNSLKEMSIDAFCMDQYEVTQAEYERVMGNNPSRFKGANRPVEKVTWHEAKAYCKKMGKRLPTEWEWEKAAKAGTTTKYYWGNDVGSNNANCRGCGSRWDYKQTAPVGSFEANTFGLYDMLGNLWEWTDSETNSEFVVGKKAQRGGSWNSSPRSLQSGYRTEFIPPIRNGYEGFRCAQ
jgi:formylglycine-generating enzyme required for sulfatase activity